MSSMPPVWDFEGGMQVRADGNFGTWYFAKNDSIYRYLSKIRHFARC